MLVRLLMAVLFVLVAVPAMAGGLVFPQDDWNMFPPGGEIGVCSAHAYYAGWVFDVVPMLEGACGPCAAETATETIEILSAELKMWFPGVYEGFMHIEIDLVERDAALSAVATVFGTDTELIDSASPEAIGAATLRLELGGVRPALVAVECCDCVVSEIRIGGDHVVPTENLGWSALKSRFSGE